MHHCSRFRFSSRRLLCSSCFVKIRFVSLRHSGTMCGIWATFGIPKYHKFIDCAMSIAGRGPDGFRMETLPHFENCCLAFQRLAILDDLFGMQPMRVKKFPHLYMIYNGEIYNYKDLGKQFDFDYFTECDGEVLLHLYDKFGAAKTAQMMDGVFAFCIIDTKKKEVHLGRDTFGIRPLFTLFEKDKKGGVLALCSEAKGLVPIRKHIEREDSIYEIKHLQPGYCASYSLAVDGQATLLACEPYTYIGKPPVFETRVQPKSEDIMENIRELFSEAVRKRLMAERRIGCFLSGGLDSSLVASHLMKLAKEQGIDYPIQTFSVGMEGSPDLEAARKVAAHIGSEHHEVLFTPEEGIQALHEVIYAFESFEVSIIRSSVPMYLLTKYISQKTDTVVVYSGEGADELCQGYMYFHQAPTAAEADEESRRLLKDIYMYPVLRTDRMTSVHGLEIRVPFLDVNFTSYFLSLPAEMRQPKDGYEKWLVRAAFDSTDALPKEILWRPKLAFAAGVSLHGPGNKSWSEMLQQHLKTQVTDEAMSKAAELYPAKTPKTKEAFYDRAIFEEFFPGCDAFTPYQWTPKWTSVPHPSDGALCDC